MWPITGKINLHQLKEKSPYDPLPHTIGKIQIQPNKGLTVISDLWKRPPPPHCSTTRSPVMFLKTSWSLILWLMFALWYFPPQVLSQRWQLFCCCVLGVHVLRISAISVVLTSLYVSLLLMLKLQSLFQDSRFFIVIMHNKTYSYTPSRGAQHLINR